MEWNNKEVLGHVGKDNRSNNEVLGQDGKGTSKETGKKSDTMFKRITKTNTKLNLESIDMEMVLLTSKDGEFHDEIETIICDKFGSNRGDKRDEDKCLKAQESKEISTNFWKSRYKTKSGEYVLSSPPKTPGGMRAIGLNTHLDMGIKAHYKGHNRGVIFILVWLWVFYGLKKDSIFVLKGEKNLFDQIKCARS